MQRSVAKTEHALLCTDRVHLGAIQKKKKKRHQNLFSHNTSIFVIHYSNLASSLQKTTDLHLSAVVIYNFHDKAFFVQFYLFTKIIDELSTLYLLHP